MAATRTDHGSGERALPLRVVVLSTLVALAAATVTYLVLDDGNGGAPGSDIDLSPAGEPLDAGPLGEVTFQDLGGTTTSLAELSGKPLVLNFFASWCVPCLTEMPAFERVHRDVADEVTFVGLAIRDRPEDVRDIVADTGVTYRIGRDIDDRVLVAVGALGPLPATALLDAEGRVAEIRRGELSESQLRSLIEARFGVGG